MPVPQKLLNAYTQDLQKLYKEKNDPSLPDLDTCLQRAIAMDHLKNQLFLIEFAGAKIEKKVISAVTNIKKYSVESFSLARFNALFFAFPNDEAVKSFENLNQPPNKKAMLNQ